MDELVVPERDELADWDRPGALDRPPGAPGGQPTVAARLIQRLSALFARGLDAFTRSGPAAEGEPVAMRRTGGPIARWISFPRGVRLATAATSASAAGMAAWGVFAMAGDELGVAVAAAAAAAVLSAVSGPLGVRLANRLHRLIVARRRYRVSELRGIADRHAVAVRGVVVARRTAASALTGREAVWSLARFRKGAWLANDFFHESAVDFLLDDGTDEPIWVEVTGGMLLDPFPAEARVQFHSTTLLELDHPFLTRLRLDDREVFGAEINIAPGDVVDVVGRLSRRLDRTAPSESGRDPPQRRSLRSGTRVPVMVRKVSELDLNLARVRRTLPKGPPALSPGEPPVRKF
ncbi:MAG TPA: hypothetical protein VMU50_10880 [Polyangia bacterium]|nr:hypothetical protein [Polyangia bacterium]